MSDLATAHAGLERARACCDLHRYDEAVRLSHQVLASHPDHAEAWCVLAQAKLGLDDDEGALDAARRAVGLSPDDEWPHRLTSIALSALQRSSEAFDEAHESQRLAPLAWQTHVRVAEAALVLGLTQRARDASARARELAPLEPTVWVVAGSVAAKDDETKLAETFYRKALAIDPQDDAAHAGLARLHLERQLRPASLAAAASGFATAVRADPRAKHNRDALDAVLRVFLARTSYFLLLVAYVVERFDAIDSVLTRRVLPLVLLAIPTVFAAFFVVRLSPAVRRHLLRTLREPLVAVATAADIAAASSLVAGVFAPAEKRMLFAGMALAGAVIARFSLAAEFRRKLPTIAPGRLYSRVVPITFAVSATVFGVFIVFAGLSGGGARVAAAGVTLVALGVGTAVLLRTRSRGARRANSLRRRVSNH